MSDLDAELEAFLGAKLPISASRIQTVTKAALRQAKVFSRVPGLASFPDCPPTHSLTHIRSLTPPLVGLDSLTPLHPTTHPQDYKNVVHSVEKFCVRAPADYKLPALYAVDAVCRAAQKADADKLLARFEAKILSLFQGLLDTGDDKLPVGGGGERANEQSSPHSSSPLSLSLSLCGSSIGYHVSLATLF